MVSDNNNVDYNKYPNAPMRKHLIVLYKTVSFLGRYIKCAYAIYVKPSAEPSLLGVCRGAKEENSLY